MDDNVSEKRMCDWSTGQTLHKSPRIWRIPFSLLLKDNLQQRLMSKEEETRCIRTTRMSPPWILRSLTNISPFFNSLSNRLRITNAFQNWSVTYDYILLYQKWSQYLKSYWNKVVTTQCLAKFQSPRAITRPKIIEPERNVNLICNLSSYTYIPNIKSISQSIANKSGRNCFISELRTWVTLYVPAT